MKNSKIHILISLVFLFSLTGCMGPTTYEEINFGQYQKIIDKGDKAILFIGSETCSACSAYKIGLNKVIKKYQIDVKYLDISKLNTQEMTELQTRFYFSGTPTTIFIANGKEIQDSQRIDGNKKYSKIIEIMKQNKFIKEK